jgi:hypothetical protein
VTKDTGVRHEAKVEARRIAAVPAGDEHGGVGTSGLSGPAFDLVVAPVLALVLVGVLALALRWTFSHGHSLVAPPPRSGRAGEYGLLVVVSEPSTFVEAEVQRRRLEDAGVRATTAPTTDGPRVLVFPEDERVARALLR